MKKLLLACSLLLFINMLHAQIQGAKLLGKKGDDVKLGYGGFFKISYNTSVATDVSVEVGALIFSPKGSNFTNKGWAVIPLKAGFRYILTGKEAGPYVEPQVGYNIMGLSPDDKNFTGFVWGIGTGYQFKPWGIVKFDLGLRFESTIYNGGTLNYVILRFAHSFRFQFKRRED